MSRPPTISFVIPCYNAGKLLQEAVQSILAQQGNFSITDIIVVDDRSDDPETMRALKTLDGTARVVLNTRARGPAGARNFGAALVTSEYLCFLDADDVLPQSSLAHRVAALTLAQGPAFVGADFAMWWGGNHAEREGFFRTRERPARLLADAFEASAPIRLARPALQFLESTLCHCGTLLIENELFKASGGFDETLMFCEDHLFFIRLASRADYIFVPTVAMWYRQHPTSLTAGQFCPSEKYSIALRRWLAVDPHTAIRKAALRRIQSLEVESARWYRQNVRYRDALRASGRALVLDWRSSPAWRELVASALIR